MLRLLAALALLAAAPPHASAQWFSERGRGKVLDDAAFDAIKSLIVVAGDSPQPAERDKLLNRLERSLADSRCWGVTGHAEAVAKYGIERAPKRSGGHMPWSFRSKLGSEDPSIGVLVVWVVWEAPERAKTNVGYFERRGKWEFAVNYDQKQQERDKLMGKEKKGLFVEKTQKLSEHSIEATLYTAHSGKAVWSSKWGRSVTAESYEQSYDDKIKPEDYVRREINEAITQFRYGLVQPEGRKNECAPILNQPWAVSSSKKPPQNPFAGLDAAGRMKAAAAMGERRDAAAVPALINALRDPDLRTRAAAADALGKIGSEDAVRPLTGTLRAKNPLMRAVAARALGRIGDPGPKSFLQSLAKRDPDARVRKAAAEAAAKIRDPGTIGDLDSFMKDMKPMGN